MGDNPAAKVSIVGLADPPCWEDIAGALKVSRHVGRLRFVILQEGMGSGATSVTIAFPMDAAEGEPERWVGIETSLALLDTVIAAAHGAEQRWAEGG